MNFARRINIKWIKPIVFSHCVALLATWHGQSAKFQRTCIENRRRESNLRVLAIVQEGITGRVVGGGATRQSTSHLVGGVPLVLSA